MGAVRLEVAAHARAVGLPGGAHPAACVAVVVVRGERAAGVVPNTRRLRDATGLSQEAAAEKCEMPTRTLQMIETAQGNLTATTLRRLCVGFGVEVVALLAPAAPMAKRTAGRPKKATAG